MHVQLTHNRNTGMSCLKENGIFLALLQQGWRSVVPYLAGIFLASLAFGYDPAIWRQVKAVFIPKPGKSSYSGPRVFAPISLTSFLLKTMKRLVDRFSRDESRGWDFNATAPQPACLPGWEILYQLDQQETALGVFLDIEGTLSHLFLLHVCGSCQT